MHKKEDEPVIKDARRMLERRRNESEWKERETERAKREVKFSQIFPLSGSHLYLNGR